MLAAGHEPEAEAGLVQGDIGPNQGQSRQQHEPVELKAAKVHQERLLGIDVLDGGGNVVHAFGGVHGLDKDRGRRSAQQVHGGAHQGLVRLEVDGGHRQQQGVNHAQGDGGQHHQQNHAEGGRAVRQELHHQRAAQGAHDHDALQADVDDAGVLGEAAAQGHQQQHRRENQRVLQK